MRSIMNLVGYIPQDSLSHAKHDCMRSILRQNLQSSIEDETKIWDSAEQNPQTLFFLLHNFCPKSCVSGQNPTTEAWHWFTGGKTNKSCQWHYYAAHVVLFYASGCTSGNVLLSHVVMIVQSLRSYHNFF